MTTDKQRPTVWPEFIGALEPDASESSVSARVPADVNVLKPSNDIPASLSAWSGVWSGWAGQGRRYDVKLIVESLSSHEAIVVCALASDVHGAFCERVVAQVQGSELRASLTTGAHVQFRMRNENVVELVWREQVGNWVAGVLSKPDSEGKRRTSERVLMKVLESDELVALELVTFKPDGLGPFPTLVFHHGSTGIGNDPSLFNSTFTSPALAKYFNDRGWMVLFPQRRGRGKSTGLYDEGFEPDRSQYSDDPRYALAGFERALEDVECIAAHVLERPDVDQDNLLIGGHSRGGFLALVFASLRPERLAGVLNFVGGWVDDQGPAPELINPVIAKRAGSSPVPSIWLYAENDPFYSVAHSRESFRAFTSAGGNGRFHLLDTLPGQDGHHVLSLTDSWGPAVDKFLEIVGQRNQVRGLLN